MILWDESRKWDKLKRIEIDPYMLWYFIEWLTRWTRSQHFLVGYSEEHEMKSLRNLWQTGCYLGVYGSKPSPWRRPSTPLDASVSNNIPNGRKNAVKISSFVLHFFQKEKRKKVRKMSMCTRTYTYVYTFYTTKFILF